MTREEAVKYGIEWLKDEYLDAKDRAFIKIALEALKQKPCEQIKWERDTAIAQLKELGYGFCEKPKPKDDVLDKIRAEIADLDDADYDYEGYYKAVTDAVKIIDKYKAESEDRMSKETTCKNCIYANECIMYEPKMKRCKDYKGSEV